MSSRILTSHFSGLEEFLQQHAALLAKSTDGTVAVLPITRRHSMR